MPDHTGRRSRSPALPSAGYGRTAIADRDAGFDALPLVRTLKAARTARAGLEARLDTKIERASDRTSPTILTLDTIPFAVTKFLPEASA